MKGIAETVGDVLENHRAGAECPGEVPPCDSGNRNWIRELFEPQNGPLWGPSEFQELTEVRLGYRRI